MTSGPVLLLAVPGVVLLLVSLLMSVRAIAGRRRLYQPTPRQEAINLLCASAAAISLGLGLQSLMDNATLARTSPFVAIGYMFAIICINHAVAILLKFRINLLLEILAATVGIALVAWYALIQIDASLRMTWLALGIVIVHSCALPQVLVRLPKIGFLPRVMGGLFVAVIALGTYRGIWILLHRESQNLVEITSSTHWQILLVVTMVMSFLLLSVAFLLGWLETIETLTAERDTDVLSGLPNRRGFSLMAKRKLSKFPNRSWFMLAADLDHFKSINDRFGHPVGDCVISGVGKLLRESLQPDWVAGRIGGEEFVILAAFPSPETARVYAQSLLDTLAELDWAHGEKVTMSLGVAPVFAQEDFCTTMERVDRRLYRAKKAGRNRVSTEEDESRP